MMNLKMKMKTVVTMIFLGSQLAQAETPTIRSYDFQASVTRCAGETADGSMSLTPGALVMERISISELNAGTVRRTLKGFEGTVLLEASLGENGPEFTIAFESFDQKYAGSALLKSKPGNPGKSSVNEMNCDSQKDIGRIGFVGIAIASQK